ncbi:MAG TPA: mechanosensitive ion channel family protein [Thermoanaerobaculia bacterium]|nr:mechanosensitive ion channel family protein [Thermoanaerobaculia bacterium]
MNLSWIFDTVPSAVAVAAAISGGVLLLVSLVVGFARRKLRQAAETEGDVDDFLLDVVRRTSIALLVLPAVYAGSRALALPEETSSLLRTVTRVSLVAQAALWSAAVVDFFLRRYRRRRVESDPAAITTIRAFRLAALSAVWCVATLVALDNLGIDVTALVTGLGIGGVAIALATQNILGDLFASLSIVLDKPFVVGDFIRSGDHLGVVEQIGLKTTRVRSLSGEQLVFSNNDLLQSRIRNYKRMDERRVLFRVGVTYQTPAALLARIAPMVRGIIEAAGEVRMDRAHFAAFGDSSYDFEFVYYVLSAEYNVYMDVQQAINLAIVDAFEKEGIEFAYPTRTLHLQRPAQAAAAAA